MSPGIYVNHLPLDTTPEEIRDLFCPYGMVETVKLITDRQTGRLCGFGFVEMTSGANEAIAALNDRELRGSRLNVKYPAKWHQERPLDHVTGEIVREPDSRTRRSHLAPDPISTHA